jgi:putative tributyrin esterase
MPWAQVFWRSDVLEKQTSMQVLLPTAGKPPFATLYLLHGLGDDSTIWLRRTRIEVHVRDLPLLVVMPDGYRGFYTNNEQGPAYARHFAEELPAFVERNFPARAARSARAVGGLSMGGYGALRLALGYPERYCSAHSHSGALLRLNLNLTPRQALRDPVFGKRPPGFLAEMQRIFGRSLIGSEHDLVTLIQRARKRGRTLPRLLLDCGREDSLIEANRTFHQQLIELGVRHSYREFGGDHTWDYWDLHIQEALAFHARNLKLPRGGQKL